MKHHSARLRFRRRTQWRSMLRASVHRSFDIRIELCRMTQPASVPVYDLAQVTAAHWLRLLDARVLAALYDVEQTGPVDAMTRIEAIGAVALLDMQTLSSIMCRLACRDREALPPMAFA